jgi:hypothetical protein
MTSAPRPPSSVDRVWEVIIVLRTVNLVVEVFIDVADDGTAYAEALMLRNADKCLLAKGSAHLRPADPGVDPVDEAQIAARALADMTGGLICGPDDGGDGSGTSRRPRLTG